MNNDLISREELKKALQSELNNIQPLSDTNYYVGVKQGLKFAETVIDNAPTVENITIFCENADEKTVEDLKNELTQDLINKITVNAGLAQPIKEEIPQSDIRWTDKVSVTSSGDIIDFEGRVVGHINLDIMKDEDKE